MVPFFILDPYVERDRGILLILADSPFSSSPISLILLSTRSDFLCPSSDYHTRYATFGSGQQRMHPSFDDSVAR